MNSTKSAYDAVLWDLDGTLVDSTEDIAGAAAHAMQCVGRDPPGYHMVRRSIGDGLQMLLERCLGQRRLADPDLFDTAIDAFRAYYGAHLADRTAVVPGIRTLLKEIDAPMAIVSNKPEVFCRKLIASLDISSAFAFVAGGETFPSRKPDPAPLLAALARLGAAPSRAVMVGDGAQDMAAAVAAGADPIGVLWGRSTASDLKEAGARVLARDVAALRVVLIRADSRSEI